MHEPLNSAGTAKSYSNGATAAHPIRANGNAIETSAPLASPDDHQAARVHYEGLHRDWHAERDEDRERSIALVKLARDQARAVRVLLDGFDQSLSIQLSPFQRLLDERLGNLLVMREDAAS